MHKYVIFNQMFSVLGTFQYITGPDPDDELGAMYTTASGTFDLQGDTFEGTTIDAHLKIYHDCNDGVRVSPFFHF